MSRVVDIFVSNTHLRLHTELDTCLVQWWQVTQQQPAHLQQQQQGVGVQLMAPPLYLTFRSATASMSSRSLPACTGNCLYTRCAAMCTCVATSDMF